jgi:hypothetical protein
VGLRGVCEDGLGGKEEREEDGEECGGEHTWCSEKVRKT